MVAWILLSFIAAFMKASKQLTTKIATSHASSFETSWLYRVFSVPLLFFAVLITGFVRPDNLLYFSGLLAADVLLFSSLTLSIVKGYQLSDISKVGPLLATYPVFLAIPAVFILGEIPSLLSTLGILLVVGGAYWINLSESASPLEPVLSLKDDKGVQYVILGLVLSAVVPSLDKLGIQSTSPITWTLLVHIGAAIVLTVTSQFVTRKRTASEIPRKDFRAIALVSVFSVGIWLCQAYAYELTKVVYVQSIKSAGVILTAFFGGFLLNEQDTKRRTLAAAVIVLGATFVLLGG